MFGGRRYPVTVARLTSPFGRRPASASPRSSPSCAAYVFVSRVASPSLTAPDHLEPAASFAVTSISPGRRVPGGVRSKSRPPHRRPRLPCNPAREVMTSVPRRRFCGNGRHDLSGGDTSAVAIFARTFPGARPPGDFSQATQSTTDGAPRGRPRDSAARETRLERST